MMATESKNNIEHNDKPQNFHYKIDNPDSQIDSMCESLWDGITFNDEESPASVSDVKLYGCI